MFDACLQYFPTEIATKVGFPSQSYHLPVVAEELINVAAQGPTEFKAEQPRRSENPASDVDVQNAAVVAVLASPKLIAPGQH